MRLVTLSLLLSAFFSHSALANDCGLEQSKYCSDVEPGQGQIMLCLIEHERELGTRCKTMVKDFRAKAKLKNPCFEDLAEWCKGFPASEGRLPICLLKHENRLSPTCANDLAKKKGEILNREPCAQDLIDKCYTELSKGRAEATRCLIKNKGKLLARCETAISGRIQRMRAQNPCFDDTEKFCPAIVNPGEISNCLEKKLPSLTKACQEITKKEIAKAKEKPCYQDIKTHCYKGLNAGGIGRCLTLNENKLSNACQQWRKTKKEQSKKLKSTCEADRVKWCAKEPLKGKQVMECLKKNKAQISKACSDLLPK